MGSYLCSLQTSARDDAPKTRRAALQSSRWGIHARRPFSRRRWGCPCLRGDWSGATTVYRVFTAWPVTSRQSQPRGPLVRFFMIAALVFSGVALLPSSRPPVLALPYQPSPTPAAPTDSPGPNTIIVDRGGSDQFVVQATVNGVELEFLIDSGASDIVLSPAAAARVGFRRSQLRFSGTAATANGDGRLAPVTLRELRVGQFSQRSVPAVVNNAAMPISLLGMSFLGRLDGWEAKGDHLMLYW